MLHGTKVIRKVWHCDCHIRLLRVKIGSTCEGHASFENLVNIRPIEMDMELGKFTPRVQMLAETAGDICTVSRLAVDGFHYWMCEYSEAYRDTAEL
jgi:hypothetical protein